MTTNRSAEELAFLQALTSEDDVGRVLRAALYIERALDAFIVDHLERPGVLIGGRFTFHQKLVLAQALGYDETLARVARTINSQRNKFAHDLNAEFDAEALIKSARAMEELMPDVFTTVLPKLRPETKRFEDQIPENQFVTLVVLHQALNRKFAEAARTQRDNGEKVSDLELKRVPKAQDDATR